MQHPESSENQLGYFLSSWILSLPLIILPLDSQTVQKRHAGIMIFVPVVTSLFLQKSQSMAERVPNDVLCKKNMSFINEVILWTESKKNFTFPTTDNFAMLFKYAETFPRSKKTKPKKISELKWLLKTRTNLHLNVFLCAHTPKKYENNYLKVDEDVNVLLFRVFLQPVEILAKRCLLLL